MSVLAWMGVAAVVWLVVCVVQWKYSCLCTPSDDVCGPFICDKHKKERG